jgi:hypothetical protein
LLFAVALTLAITAGCTSSQSASGGEDAAAKSTVVALERANQTLAATVTAAPSAAAATQSPAAAPGSQTAAPADGGIKLGLGARVSARNLDRLVTAVTPASDFRPAAAPHLFRPPVRSVSRPGRAFRSSP